MHLIQDSEYYKKIAKVWGKHPAAHHIPHGAYPMVKCIILSTMGDAPADNTASCIYP
jgi:hypothetical protein